MVNIDILNYIQDARKSGMEEGKIREGLLQSGWGIQDINEAFIRSEPAQLSPKPKWHPTPLQKWIAIIGTIIILALSVVYAYFSFEASKNYNEVVRQAELGQDNVQSLQKKRQESGYRNDQFGFSVQLPESWQGYTINHIKEDIYDATGKVKTNNGVVDSFQIIEIHHPLEAPDNPRGVMLIMVFTPTQWDNIIKEEWSVGAAPIPPSILGQNSQYILALPARYNYDFKPGWEEVDQLVHTLKSFEPNQNSTWKTYRNEEYGFEFRYPGDWIVEKLDVNPSSNEIISLREKNDDGGFGTITVGRQSRIIDESESLMGLKLLNKSEVKYNDISWKILITGDQREESLQFIDASTYKNNSTYSLGGRYYKNREVFYNQILSTFKFIK